jgi:hypothetical protein
MNDPIAEIDVPLMDKKAPKLRPVDDGEAVVREVWDMLRYLPVDDGEAVVREVWDMLRYLDEKAERIGDLCRLDKADVDSLRYANQQLDHAENMIGDMRNQIERPILESEE